jgi:Winged helix DNA-binding domain
VRSFSLEERRARLARRHFLSGDAPRASIPEMTAAVVGWHASDPATPYLSLWARIPRFSIQDLDHEVYERRSLVKHLAMRRTLWLLPTVNLHVVQPAASDRVAETERKRLIADVEKAGVAADGARWLEVAGTAVRAHLLAHGHSSGAELRAAIPELTGTYDPAPGKRWGGETHLAPRVLTVLAVTGDIVRGPNSSGWTTSRPRWVNVDDWLAGPVVPKHVDTARAALVRDWLRSFGPATAADVKWWFGATMTATRQALAAAGAVEVDLHGTPGFALPDDLEREPEPEPWAALLPGLDVTTMGWVERAWYLGAHRSQVFDTNGNAGPTAWWNGRVVGGWRQDAEARVELQLLGDVGADGRKALSRKAEALTDWLAGTRISPRFPSPLSKASST